VRSNGFAANFEGTEEGISALGMALHNGRGEVVGALSVATPTGRFRRLFDAGLAWHRPTAQHHALPLHGDRCGSVDRAHQRPANRGVGIGIASGAHRLDHRRLEVRCVQQPEKRILERDQHPALLEHEVCRRCLLGRLERP